MVVRHQIRNEKVDFISSSCQFCLAHRLILNIIVKELIFVHICCGIFPKIKRSPAVAEKGDRIAFFYRVESFNILSKLYGCTVMSTKTSYPQ